METLGCPKNRVDSEIMLGTLVRGGYSLVQDPAEAQVIVVNTCAFIGPAKQESVDAILGLAEQKKSGRCETLRSWPSRCRKWITSSAPRLTRKSRICWRRRSPRAR